MGNVDSIYEAVYDMTANDQIRYLGIWMERYPGKYAVFEQLIEPYLSPLLLFSAPVTNPILSFLQVIVQDQGLNVDLKSINRDKPVRECTLCGLPVTCLVRSGREGDLLCLKCGKETILDP